MTNNNWIEEFDKKFPDLGIDERDFEGTITKNAIKAFISDLLTKKDQEHKSELERIKGEIGEEILTGVNNLGESYNEGIQDALSIIDRHINSPNATLQAYV